MRKRKIFWSCWKKFDTKKIVVKHVDDTWSLDLINLTDCEKNNKGYGYNLVVIDEFSKYGWWIAMQQLLIMWRNELLILFINPIANQVWLKQTMEKILRELFKGSPISKNKNNCSIFTSYRAVFDEKFNRTLLNLL